MNSALKQRKHYLLVIAISCLGLEAMASDALRLDRAVTNKDFQPQALPAPATSVGRAQVSTLYAYQADFAATVRRAGNINAGGLSWQCQGQRCTTANGPVTPTVAACRELAGQAGKITAFGHAQKKLSVAELTQCNSAVPKHAPATLTLTPPAALSGGADAQAPAPVKTTPPATLQTPDRVKPKLTPTDKTYALDAKSGSVNFGDGKTGQRPPAAAKPALPQLKPGVVTTAPAVKPPIKPGGFAPAPATPPTEPASTPPASPRSFPMALRAPALTVTGTGVYASEPRAVFTPRTLRAPALTVTGIGVYETEPRETFTPRILRAPALSVTGTGVIE